MGCGSGGGGCACAAKADATATETAVARVNGVPLHAADETLDMETLRQRACTELLRQRAQLNGLLAADDQPATDGAISVAATAAIDQLLEQEIQVPDPDETACRRHFAANPARFAAGERIQLRHILFAVTEGVNVVALRRRAETTLIELRCGDAAAFAAAADKFSNCPSSQQGGDLGWLQASDCAPEFARDVFGGSEVGVLPRLVHSRHGLHIVEVLAREAAEMPPFETVRAAVAQTLRQQTWITATRQFMSLLAGQAQLEGVDLNAAPEPLVQ